MENEYGSYACDKEYTGFIRDLMRFHLGENLVLFTTDGGNDGMLKCGSVPGVKRHIIRQSGLAFLF